MSMPNTIKTSADFPLPEQMNAWVLDAPNVLRFTQKPVPVPGKAEVLVRIDAVAICATDLDVISSGPPAMIDAALEILFAAGLAEEDAYFDKFTPTK